MRRPNMWIMKIHPNQSWRSREIFNLLFTGDNPKNVIGWSREEDSKSYSEFKAYWNEMRIGDVIVVMEGLKKTIGCVVITSEPYEKDGDENSDWFYFRRDAEPIKSFDPPLEHPISTNQDTIIKYSGGGAKAIMDEVWDKIENDYYSKMHEQDEQDIHKYIKPLEMFHQIILYGAPGTGKTWTAKEIVKIMLDVKTNDDLKTLQFPVPKDNDIKGSFAIVQFHPSFTYEDFIQGIVAEEQGGKINYKVKDKILVSMANEAGKDENKKKKYILIIDEINRANLPSVLGELIYALEYRKEKIALLYRDYSKGPLTTDYSREIELPDNFYIIGTMNTADRSIGHIDYAIRRRFVFFPLKPSEKVINNDFARKLFAKVSELFTMEKENNVYKYLSPDFNPEDVSIGHSYFMVNPEEQGDASEVLAGKFAFQVLPLLKEYYKDGILIEKPELDIEGLGKIPIANIDDYHFIFEKIKSKFFDYKNGST